MADNGTRPRTRTLACLLLTSALVTSARRTRRIGRGARSRNQSGDSLRTKGVMRSGGAHRFTQGADDPRTPPCLYMLCRPHASGTLLTDHVGQMVTCLAQGSWMVQMLRRTRRMTQPAILRGQRRWFRSMATREQRSLSTNRILLHVLRKRRGRGDIPSNGIWCNVMRRILRLLRSQERGATSAETLRAFPRVGQRIDPSHNADYRICGQYRSVAVVSLVWGLHVAADRCLGMDGRIPGYHIEQHCVPRDMVDIPCSLICM